MKQEIVSAARIAESILYLRGQKVMLSQDLASLYGVNVGALTQAMKQNVNRFPKDFVFQLTVEEFANLKSARAWVAHTSRVWVSASRRNELFPGNFPLQDRRQSPQWRDAIASTRDACATQGK